MLMFNCDQETLQRQHSHRRFTYLGWMKLEAGQVLVGSAQLTKLEQGVLHAAGKGDRLAQLSGKVAEVSLGKKTYAHIIQCNDHN